MGRFKRHCQEILKILFFARMFGAKSRIAKGSGNKLEVLLLFYMFRSLGWKSCGWSAEKDGVDRRGCGVLYTDVYLHHSEAILEQ